MHSEGIDADTGAFAVESIRCWWHNLGMARYPDATCLTITADCGGSNGPRRLGREGSCFRRLSPAVGAVLVRTRLCFQPPLVKPDTQLVAGFSGPPNMPESRCKAGFSATATASGKIQFSGVSEWLEAAVGKRFPRN